MTYLRLWRGLTALIPILLLGVGCTQETQNQIGRSIQNWTGTNGVLDLYSERKVVMRFLRIDKLSTAFGSSDDVMRPYRYGYGHVDENFNLQVDPEERKVSFEIRANST
ncbi:MAG: hypothetical protein HOP18_14080, partial [Deltaproteobacteria bacterium]|nr:hypothetical protein [Deltaproteobacteria bacterium]